jgi:uncharacterized protein YaiI (UPF0178 family)
MRIRITESQYRVLVEAPSSKNDYSPENIRKVASQYTSSTEFRKNARNFYEKATDMMDELFPNEDRKPKETPEEIDAKIEEILNHVRNGDVVTTTDYQWLYKRALSDKTEEQKFKNALNQIKKIQEKLDNKKIKEILNYVRNGGNFIRKHKDENFEWLYKRTLSDKTEEQKFQNALNQISEIQAKLGIKREWWGERTIKDTLIGMGFEDIPRQGQHIYKDCRNSLTCKFYKFDIYLPYNENNYMVGKDKDFYIPKTGIIFEYDGIQHFQLNEHFGGEEGFKQRIHSDKEKNSYCQNNKQNDKPNPIKLVRIPYTSKTEKDIQTDIELALKNPSTFILTGNYPQLGWNQQ